MARRDLSKDISDRAAGELEYVLTREKKPKPTESGVSVEEALKEAPVFKVQTDRDVTRVLFISTDPALLNPINQTLDGYLELSDMFHEVHILVMRIGIPPKNPVLRASKNVWLYTAAAPYWWELPGAGLRMVEGQLAFAAGFRPDLIVARDAIESAWLALKISNKFDRPTQLHVVEDFSSPEFKEQTKANWFRRFVPYFTIKKFDSVRTITDAMAIKLADRFSPPDLKVLPRLQNYEAMISATSDMRLADKYHGFSVFLLYIGTLRSNAGVFPMLEALRIGLIIIGDGPAKGELMGQLRNMKIERQVVFEKETTDVLPYLKGAHILLVPDTHQASEETVLQGAAAGIPLLIAKTEKRMDVFVDKYSAYFFSPDDTDSIKRGVSDLLNDVEGRAVMAKNAQTVIKEQFHFDPTEYQTEYRQSIEDALFLSQNEAEDEA
jgi:glycosyltransferase involved in cell wall biosynthesis